MSNIIHEPSKLLELTEDELDDLLIDEYKNPALLRQLVRVCLAELSSEMKLNKIYKEKIKIQTANYNKIKNDINNSAKYFED